MAEFLSAFRHVIVAEGGWCLINRHGDAGGVTWAGIAQGRNPQWVGWPVIVRLLDLPALNAYKTWPSPPAANDSNPPPPAHVIGKAHAERLDAHPEVDSLRELTRDFFRVEFWDRLRLDAVDDQDIATAIYSEGVLSGVGRAARLIQAAAETAVDGHIGPATQAAINGYARRELALQFCLARWSWYIDLTVQRPLDLGNLRGWRNRAGKEAGLS